MKERLQLLAQGMVLTEGPVWCAEHERLLWVDIEKHTLWQMQNGVISNIVLPHMVGCIALIENNTVLAAVKDTLYKVNLSNSSYTPICKCEVAPHFRFNDGKCDAQGRLWVGTMAINQNDTDAVGGGSLYCIEKGKVVAQYGGYTIPNGMAWSADGRYFYHIDTAKRAIDRWEISEHGIRKADVLTQFDASEGAPDGMCIDEQDRLWVAMWGAGMVLCIDSATGQRIDSVHLPDSYVSCCTFGAADRKTLYITTACDEQGDGGNLWCIKTDATGVLPNRYKEK